MLDKKKIISKIKLGATFFPAWNILWFYISLTILTTWKAHLISGPKLISSRAVFILISVIGPNSDILQHWLKYGIWLWCIEGRINTWAYCHWKIITFLLLIQKEMTLKSLSCEVRDSFIPGIGHPPCCCHYDK